MNTIYYFFRRPILNEVRMAKKGKYPLDYFYGFTKTSKHQIAVSDIGESNKIIKFIHVVSNSLIVGKLGLSVSFFPTMVQIPKFARSNILFATVDSYGVVLAGFKKLRLINNKKLVFNTIGLCDILVENQNIVKFYSKLLSDVDMFLSGASYEECKKMSLLLNIPIQKFTFIPFGIDTNYFKPQKRKEENFVLIIGADNKRDWLLYRKLFSYFNKQKFVVITHHNLMNFKPPDNVLVLYNLPINEVRDHISKTNFLIILSKQNYHFAGQSTAFRAMSMGKPVIFTDSFGVREYNFRNGSECFLVKPGDWEVLKKQFQALLKSDKLRIIMGKNARKKIIRNLSIDNYGTKLNRLFDNL